MAMVDFASIFYLKLSSALWDTNGSKITSIQEVRSYHQGLAAEHIMCSRSYFCSITNIAKTRTYNVLECRPLLTTEILGYKKVLF